MITFNRDKEKKLRYAFDIKGIDSHLLEYYIRISSGTVDYGFKGNLSKEGVLEFTIPALGGIIKESELRSLKNIKIEVHDVEDKYYFKPMEDDINFDVIPTAVTEKTDEIDKKVDIKINIKQTDELDDNVESPKSRISRFLK